MLRIAEAQLCVASRGKNHAMMDKIIVFYLLKVVIVVVVVVGIINWMAWRVYYYVRWAGIMSTVHYALESSLSRQ